MTLYQIIDLIGFFLRNSGLIISAGTIYYIVHFHKLGRQSTRMKSILNILSMTILVVGLNDVTDFILSGPADSLMVAGMSVISGSISIGISVSLLQCLPVIKRLMGVDEQ